MKEPSEIDGIEYTNDEQTAKVQAEKGRPAKARRLISVALLAFLAIVAVILFTPSLQKAFLPQRPKARPPKTGAPQQRPTPAAASPTIPEPTPPVPVVWEQLNLAAMPAEVADTLKLGKYYYDRRQPGNFGLAIHHWKLALAKPGGNLDGVRSLIASAEKELARQFSSDSADALVFLRQGRRDQAVALLTKMRADYLDIASPQYIWTSVMLSRRRR